MGGMLQLAGYWGHLVGAALYAALTVWMSRRFATEIAGKLLVAALSLTTIWLLSIALGGVDRLETGVSESLRNCGWLVCVFVLPVQFGQSVSRHLKGTLPLYIVLVLLLVAQSALDIAASLVPSTGDTAAAIGEAAIVLRMLWAIGALILTQRVYAACSVRARAVVAPVAAALAAMWSYDLILYGAAFFDAAGTTSLLYALRGGVMTALALVIALVGRTSRRAVMMPSRTLALRGIGLGAAFLGGLLLVAAVLSVRTVADPVLRAALSGMMFLVVAGALLAAPAQRFRRVVKVLIVKHLFRHRYDYREQWMAFADAIGRAPPSGDSPDLRLARAMANITESDFGALWLASEGEDGICWVGGWNWKGAAPDPLVLGEDLLARMRTRNWIVDVPQARATGAGELPAWLLDDADAWALVPLVHFGKLIGVVLLGRPPVMRPLDWEDFDMLRVAGRQIASTLAEERGQRALEEVRRFDEFNRRFAFVMHDIKNLVSQIALVARNAERHADNPEFRADMILTLRESTDKMNRLLARLAQREEVAHGAPASFAIGDAIAAVIAKAPRTVLTEGDLGAVATADRAKVEQIVGHLVQNAVEASGEGSPVLVRVVREDDVVSVSVIDHGCGMSAGFIRDELFRPFASTKAGGFGIGAYEARELARAMAGALDVESAQGKGTRFTLRLPGAGAPRRRPATNREEAA